MVEQLVWICGRGVVGDRWRWQPILGRKLSERLGVLVADHLRCDGRVAQRHAVVAMTQEAHYTWEAHAGAQHLCRVGVTKPVTGDTGRIWEVAVVLFEVALEPSFARRVAESRSRYEQWSRARRDRLQAPDQLDGVIVEWDEPFAVQLAERNLEERPATIESQAVVFEAAELTDA